MRSLPIILVSFMFLLACLAGNAQADDIRISDVRQLTDTSMDVDHPAWSPDNRFIAFSSIKISGTGEADELWIIDAQNGKMRKLLDSTNLQGYATYGYSIWDITWKDTNTLTFIVSDNDVDSWQIKIPLDNPTDMEETFISYEGADLFEFPENLKAFLLEYYPEDSASRKDLVENYYYFHIGEHEGGWHVHHLRDPDFLIVDLKTRKASKHRLSATGIGDNLVFKAFNGKLLAIYPASIEKSREAGRSWYYIDLIDRKGPATPLVQTAGFPDFKGLTSDEFLVYSRTRTEHPFFQVELIHCSWDGKAVKLPVDGWHNLGISKDNTRIAFIRIIDGKRVLFTGDLK